MYRPLFSVYNQEAFTPEAVAEGRHMKLINFLLEQNTSDSKAYYDIHITSDGYCLIVEWIPRKFDSEYDPDSWEYCGEGMDVVKIVHLPDGHYEYASDIQEEKSIIQDFLQKNPDYLIDDFGLWHKKEG